MKVAVIGGGPAGLATLKFLSEAHKYFPIPPIDARLFEAEAEVGGTFVYRVYEDAELVSSKYLTAFSDFRLPADAPDFVTPKDRIECQAKVESVGREAGGRGHLVTIRKPEGITQWQCDAIAVCSGIHSSPRIPGIKGIERIPIAFHSSQLKTRAQLGQSTNVVVLGAGETGMDMAHLSVTAPTKSVTLCHRDGFFCAPKIIPTPIVARNGWKSVDGPTNKPVDTSVASLFDTAYVHPILQRSQLLWLYYDQWIKKMHWLISGTEEGPDQWVGQMSSSRKYMDAIMLCKSDRALPYMNIGHRSTSWINRLRSKIMNVPIKDTHGKKVDVLPWPEEVDGEGYMHFAKPNDSHKSTLDYQPIRPDVVVFATGYDRTYPFLDHTYPDVTQCDVRGIYKSEDVTSGFIGFVRPSIGAIPPLAELQAQLWVFRLLKAQFPDLVSAELDSSALETYDLDYEIHPRGRYDFFNDKRAVDHESYAYQLALDMGAAPRFSYVLTRGWKVFFTWAMGSNFNTKFRLVGPWKWERGAEEIMRNELFNVVQRSGGYIYLLTYSVIPFCIFGTLSMFLYAVCGVWKRLTGHDFKLSVSAPAIEKKSI